MYATRTLISPEETAATLDAYFKRGSWWKGEGKIATQYRKTVDGKTLIYIVYDFYLTRNEVTCGMSVTIDNLDGVTLVRAIAGSGIGGIIHLNHHSKDSLEGYIEKALRDLTYSFWIQNARPVLTDGSERVPVESNFTKYMLTAYEDRVEAIGTTKTDKKIIVPYGDLTGAEYRGEILYINVKKGLGNAFSFETHRECAAWHLLIESKVPEEYHANREVFADGSEQVPVKIGFFGKAFLLTAYKDRVEAVDAKNNKKKVIPYENISQVECKNSFLFLYSDGLARVIEVFQFETIGECVSWQTLFLSELRGAAQEIREIKTDGSERIPVASGMVGNTQFELTAYEDRIESIHTKNGKKIIIPYANVTSVECDTNTLTVRIGDRAFDLEVFTFRSEAECHSWLLLIQSRM